MGPRQSSAESVLSHGKAQISPAIDFSIRRVRSLSCQQCTAWKVARPHLQQEFVAVELREENVSELHQCCWKGGRLNGRLTDLLKTTFPSCWDGVNLDMPDHKVRTLACGFGQSVVVDDDGIESYEVPCQGKLSFYPPRRRSLDLLGDCLGHGQILWLVGSDKGRKSVYLEYG